MNIKKLVSLNLAIALIFSCGAAMGMENTTNKKIMTNEEIEQQVEQELAKRVSNANDADNQYQQHENTLNQKIITLQENNNLSNETTDICQDILKSQMNNIGSSTELLSEKEFVLNTNVKLKKSLIKTLTEERDNKVRKIFNDTVKPELEKTLKEIETKRDKTYKTPDRLKTVRNILTKTSVGFGGLCGFSLFSLGSSFGVDLIAGHQGLKSTKFFRTVALYTGVAALGSFLVSRGLEFWRKKAVPLPFWIVNGKYTPRKNSGPQGLNEAELFNEIENYNTIIKKYDTQLSRIEKPKDIKRLLKETLSKETKLKKKLMENGQRLNSSGTLCS